MKTKHTPGPWQWNSLDTQDERNGLYGADYSAVAEAAVAVDGLRVIRINPANARLIAAAPDLLAAGQEVLEASGNAMEVALGRLEDAITKARGE